MQASPKVTPIRGRAGKTKGKDKREGGGYAAWPHACSEHWNFRLLPPLAKALLFELLSQYRGQNNGDLDVSWARMKKAGWRSRATVEKYCKILEEQGWILRTRQGGRNRCNLYALTFYDIDECGGKLDCVSVIGKRLSRWNRTDKPGEEN